MSQVFKCASCAAPLEYEGKAMQKCSFCGSTVIVPSALSFGSPAVFGSAGPFGDAPALTGKAMKLAEITSLIAKGRKIDAIKEFRETFGTGLKEAKDAVEAMERGEGVDLSAMDARPPAPASQISRPTPHRGIGKAVGGTILVVTILALLIGAAAIAGTYFFVRSEIDKVAITETPVPAGSGRPVAEQTEASDVIELLKFGGEGTGAGRFTDNRTVSVDGNGRIYSADFSGGRIQVFDPAGNFITQWTADESMNDFAADRRGNIFVLGFKGITKYEGETGTLITKAATSRQRAIAVMLDGKIAAAGREGIFIYDTGLRPFREFKNAAKDANTQIGFENIAVDGNGTMFLTDRLSKDIIKFSADGKFLTRIPTEIRSPNDIALDPEGNIYLSDTSSILVFSSEGKLLKKVKATQAFGLSFNDAGEMFVAARPFVIKQRIRL
jgi:DNA-binding beta-propeller fold protein YncE